MARLAAEGVDHGRVAADDSQALADAERRADPAFAEGETDAKILLDLLRTFAAVRKKRGLSQAEIAQQMGTTQSAVSDMERGVVEPRLSTLLKYARILACRLGLELSEKKQFGARITATVHFNSGVHISESYRDRHLPYGEPETYAKITSINHPSALVDTVDPREEPLGPVLHWRSLRVVESKPGHEQALTASIARELDKVAS
ncbi:hypothetical protein Lfu02_80340 [Longispora fulva]|nr:helix-turn-helix domain-containing protein [Longispora fulva]GIG63662.1 hypothetical protein Lfu02_80340 [Longispora fulva]